MKNLGKAFEEYGLTLFDADKVDLIETYADMSIGEICSLSDTAKDFPVCRTLAAVVNAVSAVRDCFLIQKWFTFQKKFYEGTVSQKELQKRKLAAERKEKWVLREIELLLLRIDNISDKHNVEILSGVYRKYLNGECNWEMFEEIALILERFIYHDIKQLKGIYGNYISSQKGKENAVISTMFENNHCDRLVALGLVW